jgi:hypothetical protein
MAVTLPLRPDLTHYDFGISLDGTSYLLELRWNTREEAWYLDIRLEDGTDVVLGIKVVVDFILGRRSQHPARPPGVFFAVDTSGRRQDPGISDLGARVQLLYFEAAELLLVGA